MNSMTIELTEEQRQALQAEQGKAVDVVVHRAAEPNVGLLRRGKNEVLRRIIVR